MKAAGICYDLAEYYNHKARKKDFKLISPDRLLTLKPPTIPTPQAPYPDP